MPAASLDLIDAIAAPAFIMTITGSFLSANAAGSEMLRDGRSIVVRDGTFALASPEAQATLVLQLQALRQGVAPDTKLVVIPRSTDSPLVLRLLPFSDHGAAGANGVGPSQSDRLRVMALLVDPDLSPMPSADLLRKVYRLTAAECAVCLALAGGMTLEEHAHANKISALTARNQLRHASDKLGVRRQSEVVSRVLRLGLAAGRI